MRSLSSKRLIDFSWITKLSKMPEAEVMYMETRSGFIKLDIYDVYLLGKNIFSLSFQILICYLQSHLCLQEE